MTVNLPRRIFLDTNVYIVGAALADSSEAVILNQVDCFVSANRELVRIMVREVGTFECLYADEFVEKYILPES